MADNIVPFTPSGRDRSRPDREQERRESDEARRQEAEHRHLRAEEIREHVRALPKGKRGPRVDQQDSEQLARNLNKILDGAERQGVKRKTILAASGLGNPAAESTKYLHQYTLPDAPDHQDRPTRRHRLSRVLGNYLKLAESVGRELGHEAGWFLSDLVRDTSVDQDAEIGATDRVWLREIRDLLNELAEAAIRRHDGLDTYLKDLRCGHLGWHPTLGFGEFASLHPAWGGSVLIQDCANKWMGYLGFVPVIRLYEERLGSTSFTDVPVYRGGDIVSFVRNKNEDEFISRSRRHVSVTVYRDIFLGIAPFDEQRSWAACFEKRLRYCFWAGDVSFDTYDPFSPWQLTYEPAIRAPSGEITADNQDFWIQLPDGWFERLPFDDDFVKEDGSRLDSAFRYERVDLASCRKFLGAPADPEELELGDWWADPLEEVRENSWFAESDWDHPTGLTKYLRCPPGTLARAVEQNLVYERDSDRGLDERLFDAVAAMVEGAAEAKGTIEAERETRIAALKRVWECRSTP